MKDREEHLSRRDFLKRASVSSLGLSAMALWGAACGPSPTSIPTRQQEIVPTTRVEPTDVPTAVPATAPAAQPAVVAPTSRVLSSGSVTVEWLGHGSFQFISPEGLVILLDPWLDTNPTCPARYRTMEGFTKVDLILFTHGHVDHFMLPDTTALVERFNPKIIAPWELEFFIKAEIELANKGATSLIDGLGVTMVGADHSSGAQLTGFEGVNNYVGEPCGYIIEFENGFKIYHSGDTGLMADMELIVGNYYQPDLAILPIGGVFTMGPREAAYACRLIRPQYVIPEHFGTFPVLTQTTADFIRWVSEYAPQTEVVELTPGGLIEMSARG